MMGTIKSSVDYLDVIFEKASSLETTKSISNISSFSNCDFPDQPSPIGYAKCCQHLFMVYIVRF